MSTRRQFLARVGILSAGLALPGRGALAGPLDAVVGPGQDLIVPVLQTLSADTFAGLAAMVIPGPDAYSVQQGEVDPGPGGVAARAHEFLIGSLDRYLPYPDALLRPLAHHLATATADTPLPAGLAAAGEDLARQLDEGLVTVLQTDQHVPLSLLMTLLLNHLATQADPVAGLSGPFAAPFANLTMAGKAEVFRLLEAEQSDLLAAVDGDLDEPSRKSLSGLLKFVGNALITFTAFGTFCEFGVRDPATGEVTGRPVGWDIAGFAPGMTAPADGWDELIGYWADRRAADGIRTWPTGPRTLTAPTRTAHLGSDGAAAGRREGS